MVVVLVDQYTREACKLTYDVISKHATIITDPVEIGEEARGASLVFFEPAIGFLASPDKMEILVKSFDIKPILVYCSDDVDKLFDNNVCKIKADYTNVDWTFIYAVVNNDHSILEAYQKTITAVNGAAIAIKQLPENHRAAMQALYSTTCSLVARYDHVVEENSRFKEDAAIQKSVLRKSKAALAELAALLEHSQSQCHSYEALLSKDYNTVVAGFYPERPRILYIKSYSHVAGIELLLSILHSVIIKQYKSSCKVVSLVDAGCARTLRYVPKTFARVDSVYNTGTILENDFIAKVGAYDQMFDMLLTNRSGLDYLIVYDQRDTLDLCLETGLIDLRVNEMTADYANLSEYTGNIISSFGTNVEYPWNFAEVSKYTGTNSIKLTGHPTVSSLLSDFMG